MRESNIPDLSDPATLEVILRKVVEALVRAGDPLRIVLFGSLVDGTSGPHSDVDLLVVDEKPFGPGRSRRKQLVRLYRSLMGLGVSKDILLYSADEVDRWCSSKNHVVGRAIREGRVLHERSERA